MSERLERQGDQHAVDGVTEPSPGAAVVSWRRRGVATDHYGDGVASRHGRCQSRRWYGSLAAQVARSRASGGRSRDLLEIHGDQLADWLARDLRWPISSKPLRSVAEWWTGAVARCYDDDDVIINYSDRQTIIGISYRRGANNWNCNMQTLLLGLLIIRRRPRV